MYSLKMYVHMYIQISIIIIQRKKDSRKQDLFMQVFQLCKIIFPVIFAFLFLRKSIKNEQTKIILT